MELGIRLGTARHERADDMRYTMDVHLWMGSQNVRWRLGVDPGPGKMLDIDISREPSSEVISSPIAGDVSGPATHREDAVGRPPEAARSAARKGKKPEGPT